MVVDYSLQSQLQSTLTTWISVFIISAESILVILHSIIINLANIDNSNDINAVKHLISRI